MIWRVEHFEEIDSTNSWLVEAAKNGAPEGTVVYADYQSAGRGRLDRRWVSKPGASLLCSILVRAPVELDQLHLVVAAVALAARAALVRLSGVRPSLKWPNDLLVEESKLAGLLGEVVVTSDGVALVVGIGVNLTDAGPSEANGTSVLDVSGVTITPRALLDILLEEFESRRGMLETSEGREVLREEYGRALVTLGQEVRVERLEGSVHGVARGVDVLGQLVVEIDGELTTINVGDIIHLRHVGSGTRA